MVLPTALTMENGNVHAFFS